MRKTVAELIEMGGKFYTNAMGHFCDTPLNTWRLDETRGDYILIE
jgi:hypothetical protein